MNKGNNEVYEILIDEQEASVVRTIFDLYTIKGYGSQRIATYLREHGIKTRQGENFTNSTISHILGNKSYVGILRSGETESEIFSHLQIIDQHIFEAAQSLKAQRSADYKERCVPLNTKGNSLLSGNVFCGHCGGRLIVTTNGKRYTRKDGSVKETPKTRYTCYKKTRHLGCDGQTGYTVRKLDGIIDTIVQGLFQQLCDVPKDALIEKRYAVQLEEYKMQLKTALAVHKANVAEVVQYESEVIKVIRGESKLNADLLNRVCEKTRFFGSLAKIRQYAKQFTPNQNYQRASGALTL